METERECKEIDGSNPSILIGVEIAPLNHNSPTNYDSASFHFLLHDKEKSKNTYFDITRQSTSGDNRCHSRLSSSAISRYTSVRRGSRLVK